MINQSKIHRLLLVTGVVEKIQMKIDSKSLKSLELVSKLPRLPMRRGFVN